mgnify:CR=1 FL=1
MYAVIQAGGRQYKVSEGDTIKVDYFEAPVGAQITLDRVLLVGGESTRIGAPLVAGATVVGEVTSQGRGEKLLIFKKRRRKANSQTLRGFRARYTAVRIAQINA